MRSGSRGKYKETEEEEEEEEEEQQQQQLWNSIPGNDCKCTV